MSKIYVHLIDENRQELRGLFPRDKVAEAVAFFLAEPPKGKPECPVCRGLGWIVWSAGGSSKRDECGCVNGPIPEPIEQE